MRYTQILGGLALVGVTTLITTQVVSQNREHQHGDGHGEHKHGGEHQYGEHAEMNPEEMMKMWMKLAEPGPEHAHLMKTAGNWDQVNKYWMHPGAEPTVSKAKATFKPILGGRYLMEHITGKSNMMGQEVDMEGYGIMGFDNASEKHTFYWFDNHGTMAMTGVGTRTGDEITYLSEMPNPMGEGPMEFKSVSRADSDYRNTFEMYQKQEDGSWFLHMQIVSTRSN